MSSEEKNEKFSVGGMIKNFVKTHVSMIILVFITFVAVSAIIYVDKSTSESIGFKNIETLKIGQIYTGATFKAPRDVPAGKGFENKIVKGEPILENGFPVTQDAMEKLHQLNSTPGIYDWRNFANSEIFLMLIAALTFLLFSPSLLKRKILVKEAVLECVLFTIVFGMTVFGCKTLGITIFNGDDSLCALPVFIPAALASFLVAILFGQTSALYFSIVLSLGVLCAGRFHIIPAIFTFASSVAAFRIVRNIERRIDMVFASVFIAVMNAVFIIVIKVVFPDKVMFMEDLFTVLPGVAFNGFISGILVLGFLTPLESIMNTASVFRLMDLSDLNTPVMRKLLLSASGTYSHSMMVAQLAENACKRIGANSIVARVGAYYHDIGKIDHPEYFVENQSGENKHNEINPSLSASVIKSHVKLGVEKARQLHLPKQIVDIIAEHHGNSVIAYFYNEAKNKDANVSPEDFAYPGNPPATKESAVVMLADTVEAACRTLDKPSVTRLEKFIQQLISSKIENHQLENCALTFGELTLIKDSFVQILAGYYHSRIEYPNQKDPDSEGSLGEKTLNEVKNS